MSNKRLGTIMVLAALLGTCLAFVITKPAQAKSLAASTIASVLGSPNRTLQASAAEPHFWTKVGTCPYSPIPITAKNVHAFLAGPSGRYAAKAQGIPAPVFAKMLEEAKKPNQHQQTMTENTYFDTMVFCGAQSESDVVYTGSPVQVFVFSVEWQEHLYQITIPSCGNVAAKITVVKVKAPKPKPVKISVVSAYAKSNSSASSSSSSNGCTASASSASGAWAKASATGYSWGAMFKKVVANAQAKANSYANANTSVNCPPPVTTTTSSPPVTTTTTQTQTTTTTITTPPAPEIKTLTQLQELYPDEQAHICADVKNVPPGGGTVEFSVQAGAAPKGSFVSGASQSVPNGNSSVCATYQAPGSTGTNQYFATLKVGGKPVDQASMWVEIKPAPTNP